MPLTPNTPSPSYSLTLRVKLSARAGTLGELTTAIGHAGGDIGAIDIVSVGRDTIIRDLTVNAASADHGKAIVDAARAVDGVEVINVSDRVFLMHLGGKIEVVSKAPLKTRADLSMAYTPGVARVCEAIARDPEKAFTLTIKRNTVAVVTDGTAVLGLGDIGPAAALPVMEGKAMLFKEFAGVDAFPICLSTKDPDEIVDTVKRISVAFGGINLEDISAPRCFEIEERLKEELDIPVFHDDQHGTAVVVLAALINAVKLVGKRMEDLKVVVNGVGAAGVACSKIVMSAGVRNLIGCDQHSAIYEGRTEHMNWVKDHFSRITNPARERGSVHDVIKGADVFFGLSVARRHRRRGREADGERPHHLRDGEPDARDHAGGGGRHRRGDGDGAERLPEPDQQRALLPRHLPRRARLPRLAHQRGDEARRRRRPSPPSSAPKSFTPNTSSPPSSTSASPRPSPARSKRPPTAPASPAANAPAPTR